MKFDTTLIPKEHGAWVLMAASVIIGMMVAGAGWVPEAGLYAAGVLCLFLTRPGFEKTLKRGFSPAAAVFSGSCALLGSAFFAAFAASLNRWEILWWVVPLTVSAGVREIFVRRWGPRSLAVHGASVAAVALLVPATAHALSGALTPEFFGVGGAAFLYFFGPVFIVRAVLIQKPPYQAARYFGICTAIVVAFSWPIAIAFGVRALESAAGRVRPRNLKAVGMSEVGWTLLFLVCIFLGKS